VKATSKLWTLIDAVLAVSDRTLLYGPPGTGKSYAASKAGLHDGQAVYVCALTDDTPAAELRGHYVPQGGSFVWQDGPAIRAWREGARLVINEVQRASGDVLGLLLALLDDSPVAALTLPTGELVRPASGFSCVATMNGKPADYLDENLRTRFVVTVEVDELHPQAVASLPTDLQPAAVASFQAEPERRVSIRSWLAYANLRNKLGPESAAQAVFGPSAADVLASLKLAKTR